MHSCKFCKFSKNAYFAKQLLKAFSVYFLFQFLTFSHAKGCKKLKTDKSPTIEILASLNNTVKFNLKRWRKVHWHGATARSSIQQSIVSCCKIFSTLFQVVLITYEYIVHCWIVTRWIVYCEIAQPLL